MRCHEQTRAVEFLERRPPYDFEIKDERIFAIGKNTARARRRVLRSMR